MRSSTSALLGALAAVAGWMAWSMLAPATPAASGLRADVDVAAAVPAPAPARLREAPAAAVARAITPSPSAPAVAPRPPTLRDGLVMEHGLPTAVHAAAADGMAAPALAATPLPAGVRAEDAVVNHAGMVALSRSADTPAPSDAPAVHAARPATATRAP